MNDWLPMDHEQSVIQIKSVIELLGDTPLDVVDVGCGDGRILIPLAVAGHRVVGIDVDPTAMSACAMRSVLRQRLMRNYSRGVCLIFFHYQSQLTR